VGEKMVNNITEVLTVDELMSNLLLGRVVIAVSPGGLNAINVGREVILHSQIKEKVDV